METVNNEQYQAYLRSDKWKRIARERMRIDNNACVMCGSRGSTRNPLEIHHLSYRYIYHEETRIYEDLCTLCHNCHGQVHALMERTTSPNGRQGWKDNPRIPKTTTYTITGTLIKTMETNRGRR